MGTGTLATRLDGTTMTVDWANDIKSAVCVDWLPRNLSGVVEADAGRIGTVTYPWREGWFTDGIYIGGNLFDGSEESQDATRIVSGASAADGSPDFLTPAGVGGGLECDFLATTTDVVVWIESVQYTFDTDKTYTSLTAPANINNTCTVNDSTLIDQESSKTLGEWGNGYITIDAVGSEITGLDGEIAAFQKGSEIFIAHVDTTNDRLIPIWRGFAGTDRETLADNDTITLLQLNCLLLKTDGTTKATSTYFPESVETSPAAGTLGKIYFERDTGKIGYDDGADILYTYILLGYAICDNSDCIAAQCFDYNLNWRDYQNIDLEIFNTTTIRIKRGSHVSVNAKNIRFYVDVNVTQAADMDSGESISANSQYYLYIGDDGSVVISSVAPRNNEFYTRGYYHPLKYYRCIGEVKTNASSEFEVLKSGVISENEIPNNSDQTIYGQKTFKDFVLADKASLRGLAYKKNGLNHFAGKYYEKHFSHSHNMDVNCNGFAYYPTKDVHAFASYSEDKVYFIDLSKTNIAVTNITVGNAPYHIIYNPAEDEMAVANYSDNTISFLNMDAVLVTVSVGTGPMQMIYCPTNNRIYVNNYGSDNISVINATSHAVAATIGVGNAPRGGCYDSKNDRIYISNKDDGTVSVINCATNTVLTTFSVGTDPQGCCYYPKDNNVYVGNITTDNITVIDCDSYAIIKTIGDINEPIHIIYNPVNDRIYVNTYTGCDLTIIDPDTYSIVATVDCETMESNDTLGIFCPKYERIMFNGGGYMFMINSF